MQRLVLLIYHGTSHFNASFRLARVLQQHYEVTFAGYQYFGRYVEQQGFKFYSLTTVPFGLGFERWVNSIEKKKNLFWHTIKDRWRDRLYHLRDGDLQNMLNNLDPDYLLIDAWQSTDFIVLHPHLKARKIRTAFIQFMPPPEVIPGLPPANSLALPDDPKAIEQAHAQSRIDQRKQKLVQKLKFFGMDNKAIVNRRLKSFPKQYISPYNYIFAPHFKNVPQYLVTPKEFNFLSTLDNPDYHYLGFMSDDERLENPDHAYLEERQQIFKTIEQQNRVFIYCSFGTVQHEKIKPIKKFIQRLFDVVSKMNCVTVVSINCNELTALSNHKNFFVFKTVPQLEILSKANLFINHGGINSIKESIHAGVPMLVYPLEMVSDMKGNSSRVVYHKLGLRGNLSKDSATDLQQKIHELLHNPIYKTNIAAFKKIDSHYNEKKILQLLQDLQPLSE